MADYMIPTFIAATKSSALGTSLTPTEPTGTVQDDVVLMVAIGASAGGALTTPTGGWTPLFSGLTNLGSSDYYYWIGWIRRGSSAPNRTVSHTSGYLEVTLSTWAGVDYTNPFDDYTSNGPTSLTNPNPPAATASTTGTGYTANGGSGNAFPLAVAIGTHWAGSGATPWAAPTGYTKRSVDTAGEDISFHSKLLTATGSEDPGAFTNGSGASTAMGFTLIFKPALADETIITSGASNWVGPTGKYRCDAVGWGGGGGGGSDTRAGSAGTTTTLATIGINTGAGTAGGTSGPGGPGGAGGQPGGGSGGPGGDFSNPGGTGSPPGGGGGGDDVNPSAPGGGGPRQVVNAIAITPTTNYAYSIGTGGNGGTSGKGANAGGSGARGELRIRTIAAPAAAIEPRLVQAPYVAQPGNTGY